MTESNQKKKIRHKTKISIKWHLKSKASQTQTIKYLGHGPTESRKARQTKDRMEERFSK